MAGPSGPRDAGAEEPDGRPLSPGEPHPREEAGHGPEPARDEAPAPAPEDGAVHHDAAPDDRHGGDDRAGELDDATVAARWAEITAGLGGLGAVESVPPPPSADDGRARAAHATGPRDYAVDDDLEEGFVPPEPPPLGLGDPTVAVGWATVAAGIVVFLLTALVWRSSTGALLLAVGLVVAGAGILLWRMPRARDDDATGGGAVV